MSNLPHFLTDPADPNGQEFRADCMAWELYTRNTKSQREKFIASQPGLQTDDFRQRLYRCEAWWMLTYLNPRFIEQDLASLPLQQQRELRRHLEQMRAEIKRSPQQHYSPLTRGANHA